MAAVNFYTEFWLGDVANIAYVASLSFTIFYNIERLHLVLYVKKSWLGDVTNIA